MGHGAARLTAAKLKSYKDLVQHNKQQHMFSSFHLIGHIIGFHSLTQNAYYSTIKRTTATYCSTAFTLSDFKHNFSFPHVFVLRFNSKSASVRVPVCSCFTFLRVLALCPFLLQCLLHIPTHLLHRLICACDLPPHHAVFFPAHAHADHVVGYCPFPGSLGNRKENVFIKNK